MDDITPILESLNAAQRRAVTSEKKNVLVLAGAGSGKTRVLTRRIAWLVQYRKIYPNQILAVTFTNKAANEMYGRLNHSLNIGLQGMWYGTFHGLCHRLLRMYWQDADLPEQFQIIDAQDQKRLLKRLMKELNISETRANHKQAAWFIEAQKNQGVRAKSIDPIHLDVRQKILLSVYELYEKRCKQQGLVDFSELLLRAVELLRDKQAIREYFRGRFKALLVDEFQDTNALQYAWLRHLGGPKTMVFAVGDDDQSIYGWRGAQVENMQNFLRDFPEAETYRLEQNYRSTKTILAAANAVIVNNQGRLPKALWTQEDQGETIALLSADNEREEAQSIVWRIQQAMNEGEQGDEIAILYRSNAQSRVFEEELLAKGIRYCVYGGIRFFERAVVKDVLAYLRLIQNHADDVSFERMINTPPRGIGTRTLERIRALARTQGLSLWDAARQLQQQKTLSAKAQQTMEELCAWMDACNPQKMPLGACIEQIIVKSGLRAYHAQSKTEQAQSNVENLDELIVAAGEFESSVSPDTSLGVLDQFLAHTALDAGTDQSMSQGDPVQLMTLHSAKGLEFNCVFMVGMEEGLFPHARSFDEPGGLEEERRLCYVGITRAKKRLTMSYAKFRRQYTSEYVSNTLSCFVDEIPLEFIQDVGSDEGQYLTAGSQARRSSQGASAPGKKVYHARFGEGTVLACEGSGNATRVQVRFKSCGIKWLVESYADLQYTV